MAAILKRKSWQVVIKINGVQCWIAVNAKTKGQTQQIEREMLTALNSGDFGFLSPESRAALIRLYANKGWVAPPGLKIEGPEESRDYVLWHEPKKGEKSWGAVQLFFEHPLIKKRKKRLLAKYSNCILHLIRIMGANTRMKNIGTWQLHDYYAKRIEEGASPNTIGWELSTLSVIFRVLMVERQTTRIKANPVDTVRGRDALALNFASRKRSAYWSLDLVRAITTVWSNKTKRPLCPVWLVPIIWTGYLTGMRLSEILGLKRGQVHLQKRMMYLTTFEMEIKNNEHKRIPIHRDLDPILREALRVRALGTDNVFLISDAKGTRPVTKDTVELAMKRIKKVLSPEPSFSFHDTRHTFRANCSRSGVSDRIAERILGHADKVLAVSERYGEISDQEFIDAIDQLTVDHGISIIDGKPVTLFGHRPNKTLEDYEEQSLADNDLKKAVTIN